MNEIEDLFPSTFSSRNELEQTYESVLYKMSYRELIWMNELIVDRIKMFSAFKNRIAISNFRLGERVTWKDEFGVDFYGIVISRNTKTVTVQSDDGRRWRISPGLVSIVSGNHTV